MKTSKLIPLSALAALFQLVPSPAPAQQGQSPQHPVLVIQEGDTIPGTGRRTVDYLSGPVNAGGDNVGVIAVLSGDEEGALWIGHHRLGQRDLILAHEVGALQFVPNRFGAVAEALWGGYDELRTDFALKAVMKDGGLALLTSWGVAQRFGESATGLPEGAVVTGIDRIQMLLNGQTYWVANWQAPGLSGNAFFRRQAGPGAETELLMNRGDPVCGGELQYLRHFRMSQDQRHGHVLDLDTDTGSRRALYIDGQCPYAVGEPFPGSGERPTEFWFFDLNRFGRVLFGAITDASSSRNAVMALDGKVVMREGEVIDGVYLAPPHAEPNEIRLDDRGRAVTLWANSAGLHYSIFYTPDVDQIGDTRELVSENTPLDLDGDGVDDATLHRFRFFVNSGPTFSLGDTGIYIAVLLRYAGSDEPVSAIIFYPF